MANVLGLWATGSPLSQFKQATAGRQQLDNGEAPGCTRGSRQASLMVIRDRRHWAGKPEFAEPRLKFNYKYQA